MIILRVFDAYGICPPKHNPKHYTPTLACINDGLENPETTDIIIFPDATELVSGRQRAFWRDNYYVAEIDIVPPAGPQPTTDWSKMHYHIRLSRLLKDFEINCQHYHGL